jgi:uncharacterized membrane protein
MCLFMFVLVFYFCFIDIKHLKKNKKKKEQNIEHFIKFLPVIYVYLFLRVLENLVVLLIVYNMSEF